MALPSNWAIKAGHQIYFGETAPVDQSGKVIAPGDVAAQTRRIIDRYEEVLDRLGLGLAHLCFVTIYLADLADYAAMDEAYAGAMAEPYPARKVVQAPMALEGVVVEMTAIGAVEKKTVL